MLDLKVSCFHTLPLISNERADGVRLAAAPRHSEDLPSRKWRFLNNLTSNHMVTAATDSMGVTEPLVSVASIRLKVPRFDIDPLTATISWQLD